MGDFGILRQIWTKIGKNLSKIIVLVTKSGSGNPWPILKSGSQNPWQILKSGSQNPWQILKSDPKNP